MSESERHDLHEQLGARVGIEAAAVLNILNELGLEKILAEAKEQGLNRPIQVSDLKLAVRLGRNTVTV